MNLESDGPSSHRPSGLCAEFRGGAELLGAPGTPLHVDGGSEGTWGANSAEGSTAHARRGPPPPLCLLPGPPHPDPSSPSRQPLPTGEHLRICPQGYTCCTSEMEENLANRSRAELETALLEGSRALQATLAAQQRGFDGEQAWGPWTPTAGVGAWGLPRGAGQSGQIGRAHV